MYKSLSFLDGYFMNILVSCLLGKCLVTEYCKLLSWLTAYSRFVTKFKEVSQSFVRRNYKWPEHIVDYFWRERGLEKSWKSLSITLQQKLPFSIPPPQVNLGRGPRTGPVRQMRRVVLFVGRNLPSMSNSHKTSGSWGETSDENAGKPVEVCKCREQILLNKLNKKTKKVTLHCILA